jgi:hypothetical protein
MNHIQKRISQRSWSSTKILILLIGCFLFLGTENANASHLKGGQISYECLGNNQYRVNLTLYRDCNGVSMGIQQFLNISSASCGLNSLPNIVLPLDTSYEVSSCPLNSSCNGGALPGIELYVYSEVITLPQTCTDWIFSWTTCCRSASISNLALSQAALHIEAGVNSNYCNDSPVFTTEQVNYFCAGHCSEYSAGAYDPEGDSLFYALTCPLQAVGSCIPNVAGLSPTQPLFTNPLGSFGFDSNTGQMSFCTPAGQSQTAVTIVTVYQIVNGDTIGYVQKDLDLTVINSVNCTAPVVATSPTALVGGTFDPLNQTFETCAGSSLLFETIVSDPEGSTVGVNDFNTNLDAIYGVGNWSIFIDTMAPYRPDSVRAIVQINTGPQHIGMNVFTLSFTDNTCPIRGIYTRSYRLNVIGVKASIFPVGTSSTSYCPGIALSLPLDATVNSSVTGTYLWTQISGPASTFSSTNIPNPTLLLPNTTQDGDSIVVRVSYTAGACTSMDEIVIYTQVSPINLDVLTSHTTLCPNGVADTIAFSILAANSTINTSGGLYTWTATPSSFLSNLVNPGTNVPSAILNTAANDTVRYQVLYDYGLCADSVEIVLGTRAGSVIATTSLDTVCTGSTVQLMAVLTDTIFTLDTAACNSYSVDSILYAPVLGSGTTVTLSDDASSAALPIGFDFDFYCTTYNQFSISSNGFISFELGTPNGCCTGEVLPNSLTPNNLIALCWQDLNPSAGGTIDYFTTGTAPNRQLVVRFDNVPRFGGASTITVQIVLHEGTNLIDIHSTSITSDGQSTQGIENVDGSLGLAVSGRNGSVWSATNDAYRFTPAVAYNFGPITYDWTPSSMVSNATIYNPTATLLQTTTYGVSVNEQGCVRTDSVRVVLDPNSTLNAPVVNCGITAIPTSSVLFEWGQTSGAIAWEYSLDNGTTWTTSFFNDSSFLYTGLFQGACYGIWVRALGGIGGCPNNAATYLDCCTNVLSTTVIQNGITLSAVAAGTNIVYQWVDCNNGNALIVGETGQSFTPTANGNYAVRIEDGVNSVMSTCYNVNVTDMTTLTDAFGILCYPNPTTGLLQIEREHTELLEIQVFDYLGRVLFAQKTMETQLNLDLSAYPAGIYTIQFKNETESISQKIIKK